MKRLLLASALFGLAGTVGTANATELTATGLDIWSGPTPGATATSANQQALPATRALIPLVTTAPSSPIQPASGPVSLSILTPVSGSSTIGAFLATGPISASGCTAACSGTTLSAAGFAAATLFEFLVTTTTPGTLSIMHDDGVSLFADGGGGNNPTGSDLFAMGDSGPTTPELTETINLAPGSYDLFYLSANGNPEVVETNFTPAVPEPASLTVLGSALVGLGWLVRRRRKTA